MGMKAQVNVLGHAAHPLMVTLPIGLTTGAVVFDALAVLRPRDDTWSKGAFALLGLGVGSGAAAATAGFIDWLAVPNGTRARRVGLWHLASNALGLTLMGVSFAVRARAPDRRSVMGSFFSLSGFAAMGIGGWLGGELVERLGLAADPGANPNAPSSFERDSVFVRLPHPHDRTATAFTSDSTADADDESQLP